MRAYIMSPDEPRVVYSLIAKVTIVIVHMPNMMAQLEEYVECENCKVQKKGKKQGTNSLSRLSRSTQKKMIQIVITQNTQGGMWMMMIVCGHQEREKKGGKRQRQDEPQCKYFSFSE